MPKAPEPTGSAMGLSWRVGAQLGLACAALLFGVGLAVAQGQMQGQMQGQTAGQGQMQGQTPETSQTASAADRLVLARPWARVYARPSEASRHIAIVYGNDVLPVLERKDGWVKVRAGAKTVGWLSPQDASATGAPEAGPPAQGSGAAMPPPAAGSAGTTGMRADSGAALPALPAGSSNPASADSLRRLGYDEAARRKLTQTLLTHRGDAEAYRATRDMLTYHPVGDLPPLQGDSVPPKARDSARLLRESVLIEEAKALVREGKSWDAVLLYQTMVESDPKDGRAHVELLNLLTGFMVQVAKSPNMENLGLALSIYRKTYPDVPLPPEVEARVKGKK